MKKNRIVKYTSDVFKQEVTITIDDTIKIRDSEFVRRKVAAANEDLRKLKKPLASYFS